MYGCAARPNNVRCPAGNAQDSAQQAADALRLKQAKETLRAAASEAERTVLQDTERVTSIYRDTGDTIERPAAPAFARPPPPSQVPPVHYLRWHCCVGDCLPLSQAGEACGMVRMGASPFLCFHHMPHPTL